MDNSIDVDASTMTKRILNELELNEARLVFADALKYDRVRIVENDWFALRVEMIGSRLSRRKPNDTNAIVLGNTIRFSSLLKTQTGNSEEVYLSDMAWLTHELTHVWQYQHFGCIYLLQAVYSQLTLGADAYKYSPATTLEGRGEDLKNAWAENKHFDDFNREQQGDILRDYYRALKKGLDTSGWIGYVEEVRNI